jgi:two-component system, chemotaxis family, sensor kinase CheA
MGNPEYDVDPALLTEFLDESVDMLANVDALFIQLESSPGDLPTVEAIFRPVHSIKGNSAFFGCVNVKALSHEMETLLDLVRKKALGVSQPLIDVLLRGVDELRAMLERVRRAQPEVTDEAAFAEFVEKVKACASAGEPDLSRVVTSVLAELDAIRATCAADAPNLTGPLDAVIEKLKELAEEEVTSAAAPAESEAGSPVEVIRGILAQPLEDQLPDDQSAAVLKALRQMADLAADDATRGIVAECLDSYETCIATVGFDSLLQDVLLSKMSDLDEKGAWQPGFAGEPEAPPEAAQPEPGQAAAPEKAQHEASKTMRVSEAHIDTFLAYVGELIVIGDMFTNLQTQIAMDNPASETLAGFRTANDSFNSLSNNLQDSIMSIRKIPVRALLQKAPRMVRDIAAKSGKQITVEIEGQDIEIDKSLVDMLDAPLTHMVRNAADHGIQLPDEREASGKSREGTVSVSVSETPDMVVLAVQDDGAGLNYEAIRDKAQSLGLVGEGQQLRESDVVDLIFSSGVSTAKEVTDVSGRGVGMDVVKRMIEEAGGSIKVSSTPGEGSQFRVHLPKTVTTQIMEGFLVEANEQCYVLPMDKVHETAKGREDARHKVAGQGECITLHGNILPVFALREALGLPEATPEQEEQEVVVTLEANRRLLAMRVDDVLGVRKVVLREIDGLEGRSAAIAGGALMGDGSVALIIDIERLCERRRLLSEQGEQQ